MARGGMRGGRRLAEAEARDALERLPLVCTWQGAGVAFSSRSARISFHNGTSATLFDGSHEGLKLKTLFTAGSWATFWAHGYYDEKSS